jgi:hypothetical protein
MPLYTLGLIKVPTPGTPVQIYPAQNLDVNAAYFSCISTQVGSNIYIGLKGMNKNTFDQILKILWKGNGPFEWFPQHPGAIAAINLFNLWIDVDTAGDGLLVSYLI